MVTNTAIISLIPLVIFLWEHVALTNNINFKPSIFIDGLTYVSEITWKIIGIGFAYLGTHYEYYHLEKMRDTFLSLNSSFEGLIKSIQYFELGFDSVANMYQHPYMIHICSVLTVLVIITILFFFGIPLKLYDRFTYKDKRS